MMMQRVEELLKQAMGLDVSSIGLSAVERAVIARCRACGLDDQGDYLELVTGSTAELQQLVETVAVPETWFFRDPKAFDALVAFAMDDWLPRNPAATLRLLSIPCSTGEEPYSMAMALLDAGFPPGRFRIDGIDISARVVELSRRAIYGRNSFRGRNLDFRDRHFAPLNGVHELAPRIRENVRFARGNLLDPMFGADAGSYDVIFCRNLLIYFDPADQARAIAVLRRMMADQGMLFIGHSEAGLLLDKGFASARIPLAFAFRKAAPPSAAPARHPPAPALLKQALPKRAGPKIVSVPAAPARAARMDAGTAPARPSRADAVPGLAAIQRIADDGRLAEAASACAAYLDRHGPSAEALYLQGIISDAAGDVQRADACYRKVLYLEPGHQEALTHLALLLERRGDRQGAQVLNERSRRLLQAGGI